MNSNEAAEEVRDKPGIIIDTDRAQILYLMAQQKISN